MVQRQLRQLTGPSRAAMQIGWWIQKSGGHSNIKERVVRYLSFG